MDGPCRYRSSFRQPAAAQANLTGPWEVTIDSPQGAMTIDADLKQDGEALTGVITSPMGTVELKGTFKNDELSFSYTRAAAGAEPRHHDDRQAGR